MLCFGLLAPLSSAFVFLQVIYIWLFYEAIFGFSSMDLFNKTFGTFAVLNV